MILCYTHFERSIEHTCKETSLRTNMSFVDLMDVATTCYGDVRIRIPS